MDLTVTNAAKLIAIRVSSVKYIYLKIGRRMAKYCTELSPYPGEENFRPQTYSWITRTWSGSKTILLGVFMRIWNVYSEIVPDAKKKVLLEVNRVRVGLDRFIHSDGWCAYDGLVDVAYEKHCRVHHVANEFAVYGGRHNNGIESFWAYSKLRLSCCKGLSKRKFYLHLKEVE